VLVTLAPGADPDNVVDLLFQRKTLIMNHYANVMGYLDWAVDTARVLRNQIRQSDIDRLVFTPRLWRLQEMSGRNDRFVNGLLTLELTEQAEMFDRAWASLRAEINRWNPAGAELIAVDTSVFIHHPCKIGEIDYAAAVDVGFEAVRLVVPRVVIDELDRLKESGNQTVRWRAGHTLACWTSFCAIRCHARRSGRRTTLPRYPRQEGCRAARSLSRCSSTIRGMFEWTTTTMKSPIGRSLFRRSQVKECVC